MADDSRVLIAVGGAHLSGMPLNHELTERGGVLVETTKTAPCYRMFALATTPPKPGMVRVDPSAEGASALEVEVWALDAAGFGTFVDGLPTPMAICRVLLADGTEVAGFTCESIALHGALDVTSYGGWRAYRSANS